MNFGLYVILTKPILPYAEITEICVKHKIKYIQLREKNIDDKQLLTIAKTIKSITNGTDTKFIINDRADICMLANADGIHLGQDDISLADAKKILSNDKIIGLSTHNILQAKQAISEKPDYIGFGPVYKTPTKEKPDPVVGCDLLKQVISFSTVPVVAIGGIDETNLNEVLSTGAENICLVRYLMETTNFEEKLIYIKNKLER